MEKIIDLSHEIYHNMPVYPDEPGVIFRNHTTFTQSGDFSNILTMGIHSGTHVDVPLHRIEEGPSVEKITIDTFICRAFVFDLSYLPPCNEIQKDDLAGYDIKMKDCDALLFNTDWSEHFGKDDYFTDYQGISEEAAAWLSNRTIKLIGLESPSVHPTDDATIHDYFLKKGIIIVEGLNNLKEICNKVVRFFAVPLKLRGLEGSPVRAFAIEE